MRSETPPKSPRGRPPVPVLIALTVTAVALHGCLLDGVPVDAVEDVPVAAVPAAPSVQVRSLSMPVTAPLEAQPAAEASGRDGAAPPLVATEPRALNTPPVMKRRVEAPAVTQVAAAESDRVAAPATEPPIAAPEPVSSPDSPAPALAAELAPSATAPATAAGEPVVLRQPEHPVPVYRTQIPPAATLEYDIRRGSISGSGELAWRHDGSRYEARLQASVIGYTLLTQISQGGFDKAGLAPVRYTDQRPRKAARAANFQRDVGKITFSGPRDEFALPAGSQDRLSWMIQLPAVLLAEPKRAVAGGEVALYVAGVRADVDLWTLRCAGVETVETASGAVRTVKFMRTPRSAKDTQAEVWLDPSRHYLPVRARLTYGRDEEDAFELVLRELKPGP